MLPDFTADGFLPPGVHGADWGEIQARFGGNPVRDDILSGLRIALRELKGAGCTRVWIDGSFTTNKVDPSDWDGCWDTRGVDPARLDTDFLTFSDESRARVKQKYRGDVFPATTTEGRSGLSFVEFFQIDKASKVPKGIVEFDLTGWTP